MSISAPEAVELLDVDSEPVEVRRNATLAGGIGAVASVVALAYLTRALDDGGALDWLLASAMGLVAAAYLSAVLDARTPLLVADEQGIRLRLGRTWRGVPWDALDCVEVQPRRGLLRDGRLVLVLDDPDALLAGLDRAGRRQAAIARRLHGSPLAVPLSLSTWVAGGEEDLVSALVALSGDPERVVEIVDAVDDEVDDPAWEEAVEDEAVENEAYDHPDHPERAEQAEQAEDSDPVTPPGLHDPRPTLARGLDYLADRLRWRAEPTDAPTADRPVADHAEPTPAVAEQKVPEQAVPEQTEPIRTVQPLGASATPLPLRDPVGGARVEARYEGTAALHPELADDATSAVALPEAAELRRDSDIDVAALSEAAQEPELDPVADPVVGPPLAAARTRLGLSVDQLAERTRIRPHVIESIEVDDFAPCGGDFYARGHLRTLARVLGVDVAPLLEAYDERYADAPLDARRVFEAELATGAEGPIRGTRGGPNWSVLIAAVMALVLAWSIARLILDSPVELTNKPVLNGSPSPQGKLASPVPVLLNAAGGGARVVVRDGAGAVVFEGDLAFGEQKSIKAAPPVHVQSSDGALLVTIDGKDRGPLGAGGQPAQTTYAAEKPAEKTAE